MSIHKNVIKSFEGIRGIAALIVALYHLGIGSGYFSVIRNGYLFVDLFFALSGFVICARYSASMQQMGDVRSFIVRRIGRLFPLLVFSTVVLVLGQNGVVVAKKILIASGNAGMLENPGALEYAVPGVEEIVSTLTFTHALGLFDHLILNGPTWSISDEFYTYVLFVALCLLSRGRGRIVIFALLSIAGLIVSIWASTNVHHCIEEKKCLSLTYDFGFVRCIHSFFLGVLACYARRVWKPNAAAFQLIALSALCMLFTLVDDVHAAAFAFPAVFAMLVFALSSDSGPAANALKPKLIQTLGQRSYSIYLMHMPLLLIFETLSHHVNGPVSGIAIMAAYVCALYIVSGWTYRFIESPSRERFYRLAAGSKATGAPMSVTGNRKAG